MSKFARIADVVFELRQDEDANRRNKRCKSCAYLDRIVCIVEESKRKKTVYTADYREDA